MPRSLLLSILSSALLAFPSCSKDSYTETLKHITRGDVYAQQQKYPEAILEYKIAIQFVDISSLAHFRLGETYMKTGDIKNAFGEYLRAADLDQNNDEYQVKAGNLLLVAGHFEDAKNRARIVLERSPKSVPAIVLLANALVGLKDFNSAADLGKKAVDLDPERAGGYHNLGVVELLRGNADSAEQAFKRVMELDPKSAKQVLSLGDLYRAANQFAKAEAAYQRALKMEPQNVSANHALASLYIDWHRPTEAEPYLQAAARFSTDPDDQLALADYYLGMGRPTDSKAVLGRVAATAEGFVPATTRMAVIAYTSGQRQEGQRLLDEALAKRPNDPTTLSLKARLLLSDNKVEEALTVARAAVAANPRSADAQLTLGRVYLTRHETDDARKTFNEALKLGSNSIEAQLELAKLHMDRGEVDTAIDFAKQGLSAAPDSLDAQLMLVRSMAAKSDDEGKAEAALRPLLARYPKVPKVYNVSGALALARNDRVAARKAWEYALQLDPNNVDALGGLAALAAEAGKPSDAWALVNSRLKVAPKNPGLLLLGAKVRIINRDTKGAEDLLKQSVASDPSNVESYGLLARIYVSQKRTEEARKQYLELLRQEPRSVSVHTMLALLAKADGHLQDAIAWYKKALLIDSRAALPANNLAWIYVSEGIEMEQAQQLAEIARGAQPNQAEFHDTLGWIYYKKGLTAQALETLQRAVQLDPKNASAQYHLGMAYVQDGTDPKARVALQEALNLNSKFPDAEAAKLALKKLVY